MDDLFDAEISAGGGALSGSGWSRDQLSRRGFLTRMAGTSLAVVGGGILVACGDNGTDSSGDTGSSGGTGGARQSLTTQLIWIKNVEFAGWWIALTEGLYDEQRIDAEFLPGGETAVEAIVAGGGAEIGTAALTSRVVDAVNEGSDFVIFGAQYQESPDGILSLPENPIRTPEDILGKRIGVQEGVSLDIDGVLKLAGLPLDYEPVRVGFDPDPLIQGAVDGYFCFVINQPITLEHQGIEHVVVSLGDLGYRQYGNLMIGEREWVEDNHDLLVRYMRATIEGWEINASDLQRGTDASLEVGADLGLDPAQQQRQNELQIPLMESEVTQAKGLFWVDTEELAGPQYDALRATGRTQLPDPESFLDLTILEDAYQGATTISA